MLLKHSWRTVKAGKAVVRTYSVLPNDPCKGEKETHNSFSFMPLKIFFFPQRKKKTRKKEEVFSAEVEKTTWGREGKGKKREKVKEEERRMPRAERTRRRFPPSSAVVIKDECVVDIDLPCRTEEPRSFLQYSFIIVTGWGACAHTPLREHQLEGKLRLSELSPFDSSYSSDSSLSAHSSLSSDSSYSAQSSKDSCWDTAAQCCMVSSSPPNYCTFYYCHMSRWRHSSCWQKKPIGSGNERSNERKTIRKDKHYVSCCTVDMWSTFKWFSICYTVNWLFLFC